MSLAEKFEAYFAKEYGDERYETTEQMMKAAFYAGAETGLETDPINYWKIQAEIDYFRSHK